MFNWSDPIINTATWIIGTGVEYDYFNFFFTLVSIFGMMAWGFGLLCKIISKS